MGVDSADAVQVAHNYGTPFATKFRQNVIGVCIPIFNNRFFTVDFFDLHVNDL